MEDIVKANVVSANEKEQKTTKRRKQVEQKVTFPNRRERREYEKRNGILKKKRQVFLSSVFSWSDIVLETIKQGKHMHESNREIWRKEIEKQLQDRESNIVTLLKEQGKDEAYINSYLERWAQDAIGDKW